MENRIADVDFKPSAKHRTEVKVAIIRYKEDGIFYVFAPALDILGYGQNEQEADDSFRIMLEEFLSYAIARNTLEEELLHLGWKREAKKTVSPPSFDYLISHNPMLADIVNRNEFTKLDRKIALALAP